MVLSSVMPPLASAYLKLMRAQEHLDPLTHAIRQYEISRPYDYVRETHIEEGEHIVYGLVRPPPAADWYGPLGDVVHNLRAALDHAAFGLSSYCQGRSLTDGEAKSVEWPVLTQPEDWAEFVRKKEPSIRFLSESYREVVESEQPYRGTNDYIRSSHPMHVLHSLWNLDKHRQIIFFAAFGEVMHVFVTGSFDVPHRVTPAIVEAGSEVVRVPIASLRDKEDLQPVIQVQVSLREGGPPRHPATGAPHPIGGFLDYMHNRVFGVLQAFTELLERGIR